MIKSSKLEELCRLLYMHPVDWRKTIARFKTKGYYAKKGMTFTDYAGTFGELHLDTALETINRKNSALNINLNPFDNMVICSSSADYSINERGRLMVTYGHDVNYEYDEVITIDDLPVVFEIKLRKVDSEYLEKCESLAECPENGFIYSAERSGSGPYDIMNPDVYEPKLSFIESAFDVDEVGHVLIFPSNTYMKLIGTRMIDAFQKNNGIVLPLYATGVQFMEEVEVQIKKNKFKVMAQRKKDRPEEPEDFFDGAAHYNLICCNETGQNGFNNNNCFDDDPIDFNDKHFFPEDNENPRD